MEKRKQFLDWTSCPQCGDIGYVINDLEDNWVLEDEGIVCCNCG